MKVAFFGTSNRSTTILDSLRANFELVLCVTKTDAKVGRQQELTESGVKKWAKQNNIPYICLTNFKGEEVEKTVEQLNSSKVGLGLVADFSLLIPERVISHFRGNLINIHFSILPMYRGASPVQFALINGDRVTGITYLLVSKELDGGNILSTIEYNIPNKPTAGELYSTLFKLAAENLPKVIKDYTSGKITTKPQNEAKAMYTYSKSHPKNTFIYKEDAEIDWRESVELVERKIRAYNPWPIAWTTLGELEKSSLLSPIQLKEHINKDLALKLYGAHVENELLLPETVQVENKKVVSWSDFRNGYLQ